MDAKARGRASPARRLDNRHAEQRHRSAGNSHFQFSQEGEAALRRLQARLPNMVQMRGDEQFCIDKDALAAWHERGLTDVALHGLRTCALPSCGATEPHPRFFKCCSRCRSVYYCSHEHQREDWSRHRRADRCIKPPT